MVFEEVQPFKSFWAQETRIGAILCVYQEMIIQGRISREALAANVAGKGVGFPTMDSLLLQLVFVPEGLPTVCAFKRTETLPDKKVLQRCILQKRETEIY